MVHTVLLSWESTSRTKNKWPSRRWRRSSTLGKNAWRWLKLSHSASSITLRLLSLKKLLESTMTFTSFLNTWNKTFTNLWKIELVHSLKEKLRALSTRSSLVWHICTNMASSTETWSLRTCWSKMMQLKLLTLAWPEKFVLGLPLLITSVPVGTELQKFFLEAQLITHPSTCLPWALLWLNFTSRDPSSLETVRLTKSTRSALCWEALLKLNGLKVTN